MEKTTIDELLEKELCADDAFCYIVLQILKARKSKEISQEDLAARAEVDVKDLKLLESFAFEKVSIATLSKILFAFELKVKVEN